MLLLSSGGTWTRLGCRLSICAAGLKRLLEWNEVSPLIRAIMGSHSGDHSVNLPCWRLRKSFIYAICVAILFLFPEKLAELPVGTIPEVNFSHGTQDNSA